MYTNSKTNKVECHPNNGETNDLLQWMLVASISVPRAAKNKTKTNKNKQKRNEIVQCGGGRCENMKKLKEIKIIYSLTLV